MIVNSSRRTLAAAGLTFLLPIAAFAVVNLYACLPAYGSAGLLGDADLDGDLDADDANLLTAGIATGSLDPSLDADGNGIVDVADLDLFFSNYSVFSGVPLSVALVDVNFDTLNTPADYDIIVNNLSLSLTAFTAGNLSADGMIDSADLSLYLSRGGVVPEPATLVSLLPVLLFASVRVRRRSTFNT